MPQKVYDKDGKEFEVATPEEIKALEEKAKKVEELEKDKDLINWKEFRAKEKKLKDNLKNYVSKEGKTVDEEGNIITPVVDENSIQKVAEKTTNDAIFNAEKERLIASYSEEQRKAIKVYFDKFITGEEKNIANLHKFIGDAIRLVAPEDSHPGHRAWGSPAGSTPTFKSNEKASDSAKKMGAENFGMSDEDYDKYGSDTIIIK